VAVALKTSVPSRFADAGQRSKLRRLKQPAWIGPMLATLTDDHFSDPAWIYERKIDGVRCLAFRSGSRIRLMSRNQHDISSTYPELVTALARQSSTDFIVDGEVVALEGEATSFSRLQARLGVRNPAPALVASTPVHFYVFDVLHLDGYATTALTQLARKQLLRRALQFRNPLRYTEHRAEQGERFLQEACRQGWEGLIAKRADAPYASKRSRDWLKFKCLARQELVIGGYTDPQGARREFGALLVGYHERGRLRYAGKVGTGYDERTLETLGAKLRRLARKTCPFDTTPKEATAHWVQPELVGEFGFTEWTGSGKLRHPSFYGLRTDKDAREVRRERPRG
jgi:DNA ligase D-like protein (predicted ligase)